MARWLSTLIPHEDMERGSGPKRSTRPESSSSERDINSVGPATDVELLRRPSGDETVQDDVQELMTEVNGERPHDASVDT